MDGPKVICDLKLSKKVKILLIDGPHGDLSKQKYKRGQNVKIYAKK